MYICYELHKAHGMQNILNTNSKTQITRIGRVNFYYLSSNWCCRIQV